jgi:hypothetical protein
VASRAASGLEAHLPMGHTGRVTRLSFARSSCPAQVGNLNSYLCPSLMWGDM